MSTHNGVEDGLQEVLQEDANRPNVFGDYHPSEIAGCPLKAFLNWMTDDETTLNCYLFQGSAVHHYLQETGRMTRALEKAGFHPVNTSYEVPTDTDIGDGVTITGTCDILTSNEDETIIYDIKYTSLSPSSTNGRVYKYFSQANIYAHMFGADGYGLIMINNRSQDLVEDVAVMEGELSEENWEIVKDKARSIHRALTKAGYDDDVRWENETLEERGKGFWKEIMEDFDSKQIPSYEGECKWCSHSEYCPEKNGMLGGVNALID